MSNCDFAIGNAVAYRYAKSLYEFAVSSKKEDEIYKQIDNVQALIMQIPNWEHVIKGAALMRHEGIRLVEYLTSSSSLIKEVVSFLYLVLQNKRLLNLLDICAAYKNIADADKVGIVVNVTTASPLSAKEKDKLSVELSEVLHRPVTCNVTEDSSLVSGVKIQYKSKIVDYSAQSKIRRMCNAIRGNSNEN